MHRATMLIAAALAASLAGCGKGDRRTETAQDGAASQAPTPEQVKAILATLPAPYNAGDVANGEAKEAMCRSCHTTEAGAPNMTGPNLHGVFGRPAGQAAGFHYSDALKASGIVWDAAKLDSWITDPHAVVPQTRMSFAGLKDAKDRVDVIAYLKVATSR